MPIINICAIGVVVLLFSIGFFQPVRDRYKARKYRRKALPVLEPRIWFGAEGVYDEASGYTSLKKLIKVSDHTKTKKTITFTLEIRVGGGRHSVSGTFNLPVSFSVPTGCEEKAKALVRRYKKERLSE